MVNIYDLMDAREMVEMTEGGYVRVQTHPVYPFNIACYTKQAMFERAWNDVTMNCRGLIYHQETGEILARPFKKFFNYGEPDAPALKPSTQVIAFDKLDGSLGISYLTPDGPAIATKGSFASEQALHATELLRGKYGSWCPPEGHTALFEIIYPENRIVLDYGNEDKLVLLGLVNNKTGKTWGWEGIAVADHPFEMAQVLAVGALADVVKSPDRPNREGMVLKVLNQDVRIKVKQQDYIELHKVMTGLNERQLWEWLSEGREPAEIIADLPEELHNWADPILTSLSEQYVSLVTSIGRAFQYHVQQAIDRKDFAMRIKDYPSLDKGVLFCMLDGQFERGEQLIWKAVRP